MRKFLKLGVGLVAAGWIVALDVAWSMPYWLGNVGAGCRDRALRSGSRLKEEIGCVLSEVAT